MSEAPQGGQDLVVTCPVCRKPARWEAEPRGPFCSERCRLVDLGAWAEGRYTIPGAPHSDEETPPTEPGELASRPRE